MATKSKIHNGESDGFFAQLFSFPHPANDYAARMVAGMVVILTSTIIIFDLHWVMFFLAYGFAARVATGPKLSPFGLLATRVIVPLLGNIQRPVAGPPKRFAQTVGLGFSLTALVFTYLLGNPLAGEGVLSVLVVFAFLEASVGFCAGCFVFGYMMRWGLIPKETCEKCNNLSFNIGTSRRPSAT